MTEYHPGELSVRRRAGLEGRAAPAPRAAIPDVAASFLAAQPMIVIGAADRSDRIWATMLVGEPGFLKAGTETLAVEAAPSPDDPLAEALAAPAKVGTIAIDPATRRRMRVNGTSTPTARGLSISPDQVISNCQKYIQQRSSTPAPPVPRQVRSGTELTPGQRRAVEHADTFFIATAAPEGDADASHRGGDPGFLRAPSPTRLLWPDYAGNAMFLTLGNLELRPAAGLLIPLWDTGTLLQITGTARTVWADERISAFPGAQRLIDFTVREVRETTGAMPLRWSAPVYSRFNP